MLAPWFDENERVIEIGVDEAGRGPMFGRVYVGAAVLPKTTDALLFDHSLMKDSKRFHSRRRIEEVANYIQTHAVAWAVEYEDERMIDSINILQATQLAMHKCIRSILNQLSSSRSSRSSCSCQETKETKETKETTEDPSILLLIDGNYFVPFYPGLDIPQQQQQQQDQDDTTYIDSIRLYLGRHPFTMTPLRSECVKGGDNAYTSIAAASILAKVARDQYIDDMCAQYPYLASLYKIHLNKGYGAKCHMDMIRDRGITLWHRRSFGSCKTAPPIVLTAEEQERSADPVASVDPAVKAQSTKTKPKKPKKSKTSVTPE